MASCCETEARDARQRRLLWAVLVANALMFVIEFTVGWLAQSTGLIADSLDMLADAAVYSIGLYAVGRAPVHKARAALVNGGVQFALGLLVCVDVARRTLTGSDPNAVAMGWMGALALAVNLFCFVALTRQKGDDINLHASWVCARNDMAANVGVMLAAVLVVLAGSSWPDLVIGLGIAGLILHSSVGIIRAARTALRDGTEVATGCCAEPTSTRAEL